MGIIQLPDALANKISAGEVVERPASVVKELVENSIDADSSWIRIEITEAGIEMIKVTDDGNGMNAQDIEKAFSRHATSKIKNETDLFHVATLGFRGEALASIASVSKLAIRSATGSGSGRELTITGGEITERKHTDARKGTTISVGQLFYNTPARLKYVKTLHTELGHITDIVNREALAHPSIRFELLHNEKRLFQTSGNGNQLHVIAQIYGRQVAENMLPIASNSLDYKLTGYVAKPEITRSSRSYITLLLNGRYVRNMAINRAILNAYHTLLPINRLPIVVLDIQMDSILIDVNVHPTKLEVRLSKEKELVQLIEKTLRSVLRTEPLIPKISHESQTRVESTQPSFQLGRSEQDTIREVVEESPQKTFIKDEMIQDDPLLYRSNRNDNYQKFRTNTDDVTSSYEEKAIDIPIMYSIGQLQGTYILAQNENGFFMVDQHAAQERIKYEAFLKLLGEPNQDLQELLMPITIDCSQQETLQLEQQLKNLSEIGLTLESFGENTFIVRAHPTWLPKGQEIEIIREVIDYALEHESVSIEKIREEAAIMMSCKRSIKANHALQIKEMDHLLDELRLSRDPYTCPHGRPIIVHFSTHEIEKMFKRVM